MTIKQLSAQSEHPRNVLKTISTLMALTAASGRFHENGIAPGEYRLFAWDDLDDVEYKDARLLRQFAKQSTLVSVAADSSITGLEVAAIHVVD